MLSGRTALIFTFFLIFLPLLLIICTARFVDDASLPLFTCSFCPLSGSCKLNYRVLLATDLRCCGRKPQSAAGRESRGKRSATIRGNRLIFSSAHPVYRLTISPDSLFQALLFSFYAPRRTSNATPTHVAFSFFFSFKLLFALSLQQCAHSAGALGAGRLNCRHNQSHASYSLTCATSLWKSTNLYAPLLLWTIKMRNARDCDLKQVLARWKAGLLRCE